MSDFAESPLEASLGYRFRDRGLLRKALTHRSYSNERGEGDNYERLEFLGDAVLGLVASEWLYERFPEEAEGQLAKWKSVLVSASVLAGYAESVGLGTGLLLGVGEDRSGGRAKQSILADAVESVFGAVYLEGGPEAARRVIVPVLEQAHAARERLLQGDAKTVLQELVQGRGWGLPAYEVVAESGPDHDKSFTIACRVDGEVAGSARGKSKKIAAQGAAAAALDRLDLVRGEP